MLGTGPKGKGNINSKVWLEPWRKEEQEREGGILRHKLASEFPAKHPLVQLKSRIATRVMWQNALETFLPLLKSFLCVLHMVIPPAKWR